MAIFQGQPGSMKIRVETYIANVDLRNYRYCAVVGVAAASGKTKVALPAAKTDILLGILQNAPNAGELAEVQVEGDSPLVASGAFNNGVELAADTSGQGVAASANQYVIGVANEAATAAGHRVQVSLRLGWKAA
jgi:hypothetical protein